MSSKDMKDLRKQLRGVVSELLPVTLSTALVLDMEKALRHHIDTRLDAISKHIDDTLARVDERSKDMVAAIQRAQSPLYVPSTYVPPTAAKEE